MELPYWISKYNWCFFKKKIIFGLPYPCMENYQVWRSCIPRVYVSISYHNWPIFLFLLTILWNSQSGGKKLDFLFYLVLQVHQHITIQYTSRPFHIVISPSPLEPNLQKKEKYYILISGKEWLIFFRLRHLPYYFHLRKNFGDDITSSAWEKMDLHKW